MIYITQPLASVTLTISSLLSSIVYNLFFVLFRLPQQQQQESSDPGVGSSISSSGPIVDS
nr:MAG TPA: hypothetical protein [Caudoviricetes sp.]